MAGGDDRGEGEHGALLAHDQHVLYTNQVANPDPSIFWLDPDSVF